MKLHIAAILTVLTVSFSRAAPAADSLCLACHGETGDSFHLSVHAPLGCTGCHSDIKGFPHPDKVAKVDCSSCHAAPASGVAMSVHLNASPAGANKCQMCHGDLHAIVAVKDAKSPVSPLKLPRTCGTCHGDKQFAQQYGLPEVYSQYMDSIHGFALTKDGLLVAAVCSSCHGSHEIRDPRDPKSSTNRANIPATCGACHEGVKQDYFAGIHGKALQSGDPRAPVCTSCHTSHQIMDVRNASFQMKTSATCGGCHLEKYRTYRDTFHSQVSALGYVETAHCWDCHGEHKVLSELDPKSPVSPVNLVQTCSKCHTGANASFVTYAPHADAHNGQAYPLLHASSVFMNLLLTSVLGFFALHTILWFIRSHVHRRGKS